jgi:hypothetical protein
MRKISSFFVLFLALTLCTGCEKKFENAWRDNNLSIPSDSYNKLSRRHLEYWDAMSHKDFKKTYTFELPYVRYIKDFEWYDRFNSPNQSGFVIVQYAIEKIDAHRVRVKARKEYEGKVYFFNDIWILVNNTWYHKTKTSRLPPMDDE